MTDIRAVLFDLLTALVDSWTLWGKVAGSPEKGRIWRQAYLRVTYGTGTYRAYQDLLAESARAAGCPEHYAASLAARWGELAPWPEVPAVLDRLRPGFALGVVTNCSEALARRTACVLGPFASIVTAERAGFYKPHPRPYRLALEELSLPAHQVLFVAGSGFDLAGAASVGMPVYWHNRAALPPPEGAPAPLAESRDLHTIADWLLTR